MSYQKLFADMGLTVPELQREAISKIISQNIDSEVNFNSVRATLPKMLSGTHAVVRVNNRVTGDFIACSFEGLTDLIQDALEKQQVAPSFFDDMESFETKEKIGMAALDEIPARAAEYSKKDTDALKGMFERKLNL